jgi:hypothetical protein
MTTTTFTSGTVIASSWLNDVNSVTYTVTGGGEPGAANSALELKTKRMYGTPSNIASSGGTLPTSYYFDINKSGNITSADSVSAIRLVGSVVAPSTDTNVNVAYGSSFGTKKVGIGFHTGTAYDILQASGGGTPPTYNSEVNGVVFGYMAAGPRIVAQDVYVGESTSATPASYVISYVANQHRLVGGLSVGYGTTSVTASTYTVLQTDFDITFATSASCTVTLPIATQENVGRILFLKNTTSYSVLSASANVIPQNSTSAQTTIFPASYGGLWTMLKSDGTNWNIVASNIPKIQTYTDFTASRAVSPTTYTNTTGAPIFVAIRQLSSINSTQELYVNGLMISGWDNPVGSTRTQTCTAMVPPGATYKYVNTTGNMTNVTWMELS